MRRITVILSLALGLITALALAASIAARPIEPSPGPPTVAAGVAPCVSTSASATVVPGGVYRAMVAELREHGYSRAEIQAEIGDTLIVAGSGSAQTGARRCK